MPASLKHSVLCVQYTHSPAVQRLTLSPPSLKFWYCQHLSTGISGEQQQHRGSRPFHSAPHSKEIAEANTWWDLFQMQHKYFIPPWWILSFSIQRRWDHCRPSHMGHFFSAYQGQQLDHTIQKMRRLIYREGQLKQAHRFSPKSKKQSLESLTQHRSKLCIYEQWG